ncbi:MAG TPA: DUF6458 family protein [Acidimicrobiales bacterium]|jgi:hypothetical protein
MGIGVSIFLIAVGAILTFAVEADVSGLDIDVVGVILMVVGVIGLLLSLFVIDSWRRRGVGYGTVREERVVRDDPLL